MKFILKNNNIIITEEITSNGEKKIFLIARFNGKNRKFKQYKESLQDYFDELYCRQINKIKCCIYNPNDEPTLLSYVDGCEIALTFKEWVKWFYSKDVLVDKIMSIFDFNSSYPLNAGKWYGLDEFKVHLNSFYGENAKVKKGE